MSRFSEFLHRRFGGAGQSMWLTLAEQLVVAYFGVDRAAEIIGIVKDVVAFNDLLHTADDPAKLQVATIALRTILAEDFGMTAPEFVVQIVIKYVVAHLHQKPATVQPVPVPVPAPQPTPVPPPVPFPPPGPPEPIPPPAAAYDAWLAGPCPNNADLLAAGYKSGDAKWVTLSGDDKHLIAHPGGVPSAPAPGIPIDTIGNIA